MSALLESGNRESVAFVAPETGRKLTHGQFTDHVTVLAGRLAATGVRRGDRIALSMYNGPEIVELITRDHLSRGGGCAVESRLYRG